MSRPISIERRRLWLAVVAFSMVTTLVSVVSGATSAEAVPVDFEDAIIAEVDAPMDIAWTPDGRILIPTKSGQLRVIVNDVVEPTPAIDLGPIMCTNGERALGGVAVHPNFSVNRYVYLYYTFNKFGTCNESEIDGPVNRLSRFVLSDTNVIDPASEVVLFDTPPLFRDHHNSGDIEFGMDGLLYVTVGDGGSKRFGWPQDPGRLLGKIVRLTDDGGIPPGNPHTGPDSARCNLDGVPPAGSPAGTKCQEVFSQGLRNPFRFAFDPNAATTRFYVNDVGQSSWEEISEGPIAGADYGWPVREGPCLFDSTTECTDPGNGLVDPIHWYGHGPFGGAATGGAFVPDGLWPAEWDGVYLYADYVFGKIYSLRPGGTECRTCDPPTSSMIQEEFGDVLQVVEMAFGPHGATQALYYVSRDTDAIHRITFVGSANRAPAAVATATPTSGALPLNVQFDGSASTDPDGDVLTYEWDYESDGTIDSTAVSPSHTYSTAGTFIAELTVTDPSGVQGAATVRIDPGNTAPIPTMTVPAIGATFAVGDTIVLSGSATDPEEGPLGDSSLTWEVRQHHSTHWHPLMDPTTGNNIPIIAPEPEDLLSSTNSFIEVLLTATDSAGVQTTISRDVMPRKVDVSLDTVPSGLDLLIDDAPVTTPATIVSWENHGLRVEAPDQADSSGDNWAWLSWSDGGSQSHTVTVPATPIALAATFEFALPSTLVFNPTDDATIREDRPDRLHGSDPVVEGDASPVKDGLFRFDVTGTGGQEIASATLRLFVMNSSSSSGSFSLVSDSAWDEDTVTWANAPVADGGILDTLGDTDVGLWVDVDVTAGVTGDGPLSVRLSSTATNGVDYASKEDLDGNQPELVIELGAPPGPDETPPTAPGSLFAVADTPTEVELSWSAAVDNVGVVGYDVYRDGGFLVGLGAVTNYEDFSVLPDTTYVYFVVARDAAGNTSPPSNTFTVTMPAPDVTPPSMPGALQALVVGPSQVDLSWTASTDDHEVFAYDVYRDGGLLDSTSGLAYQDLTVLPDTTYDYFVVARDAAGNESDPSSTETVTTPSLPSTIVFNPTDDATIRENRPDRNLGAEDVVEVDGRPVKAGLIRFDVSGVGAGTVVSATLRLYVTNSSSSGGTFVAMTDTNWSEATVTWANAPLGDGGTVAVLGRVARNAWIEVDITGAVIGDGAFSLRIASTVSNGVDYSSKEHASGNAPELVLELG
ncbi:MAG: PQQ-dependent sugar dehydrogenase [Actinomycetota bacterium]|nr:PQQ-dependent sugar dehydrogenase [Actinomycetota bacterium]